MDDKANFVLLFNFVEMNFFQIKIVILSFFLVLGIPSICQQKELDDFCHAMGEYEKFIAEKKKEKDNKEKSAEEYRSDIDKAFRKFILKKNSQNVESFRSDKTSRKYIDFEGGTSVYVFPFKLKERDYIVYSYSALHHWDYYIKDVSRSKIVYRNDKRIPFVDSVYVIDDLHFLIVEKYGDMNLGRRAFVVRNDKKKWRPVDAFEGKELLYREEMQFKERRRYLTVFLDFETKLNAPKNASCIYFDESTRTIRYHTFETIKMPGTISAPWLDTCFKIDDYDVGNDVYSFPVGAPGP